MGMETETSFALLPCFCINQSLTFQSAILVLANSIVAKIQDTNGADEYLLPAVLSSFYCSQTNLPEVFLLPTTRNFVRQEFILFSEIY